MTQPQASPSAPPLPLLRGEHVYLRPAEREDLPRFVRWFSDAETTRGLMVRAPFSLAAEEHWFEDITANQATRGNAVAVTRSTDRNAVSDDTNINAGRTVWAIRVHSSQPMRGIFGSGEAASSWTSAARSPSTSSSVKPDDSHATAGCADEIR